MAKPSKPEKPKFNKASGRIPTLQFCRPEELRIDPSYQRDIMGDKSQNLIRRIAVNWNWDLCLPLVVARRTDFIDRLFVIDGQHRLAAAKLRGDIDQLPCVILSYAAAAEEAASFVALNQQRKPLSRIDLFKAAVVSGTGIAPNVAAAIEAAGLMLTAQADAKRWKPGWINNIGGIESAWLRHGAEVTSTALQVLARAFAGQVLQYAGTIFPGIVAICVNEMRGGLVMDDRRTKLLVNMLSLTSQNQWRDAIAKVRFDDPNLKYSAASARAFLVAWEAARRGQASQPIAPVQREPVAPPPRVAVATAAPKAAIGMGALEPRWCDQCQLRVAAHRAAACQSQFCSLRKRA